MTVAIGGVGPGAREVLNKVLGILEQGLRDIARARDTVIDTSKRNIADVSWIKVKNHIQLFFELFFFSLRSSSINRKRACLKDHIYIL